jgi:hypothetical protein
LSTEFCLWITTFWKKPQAAEKVTASMVAMLVISDNISPGPADQTIEPITMLGVLRGSKTVHQVIADWIR